MPLSKYYWKLTSTSIAIILAITMNSCFRKYRMTEGDIKKYYSTRNYAPSFKTYKIADRTIHYAEVGSDTLPLLVFIHGAPGAWYGYIHMLDDSLLRANFKVISVDRSGYGKSNEGDAETSIEIQAQLLQPIIDRHRGEKRIIIVGRSFGAPIAAKLAASNTEKMRALFLLGPDIDPTKEKFWWFSPIGNSVLFKWMLPSSLKVANKEKYTRVAELTKLLPTWEKIYTPVIVMHGAKDWIVDTANVHFAKRMLINSPLSKFTIYKGVGHVISNERPDLLKSELLKFEPNK